MSVDYLEDITGYDFLSTLPDDIERVLERRYDPRSAALLASDDSSDITINNFTIYPDGVNKGTIQLNVSNNGISEAGTINNTFNNSTIGEISSFKTGIDDWSFLHQYSRKVGGLEVGVDQTRKSQVSSLQVGSLQVGSLQVGLTEISTNQNYVLEVNSPQPLPSQINSTEIPLPSSITLQQLLSSHNYSLQNTTVPTWTSFLTGTTPFNLNIEVTDLPTGQLAEAQITQFNNNGVPTGGTLYLDTDANGIGWFIDATPWDNTEYSQTLTDTAYRATPDSLAYGHYDLLTTLLHETAHLQGFIAGYSNYDNRVQTLNGSKVFIGDTFSAILTPDGSHLNSQVYPYDLMNTTLTPGVRKLPSALDIAILNTLRQPTSSTTHLITLTAPLSAGALIAINNGSFDTTTDWYTRGDSQILNGQAVLSEDSPYLSHLSQTFVIPQGAKALQFTLVNTNLRSSNTRLAPSDAFEVALLNHTTNTSVLAPLTGLSQTDALLNIQSNGQTYTSNAVTLGGVSGAEPRTVQIDVSTLTPGTVVTLYFDLLGFGAKDSSVTIDDVQILSELSQAPIAQNDSATTNQNTAVTVNILENDTDPDGTLNPSSLIILQTPQHGQVSLNLNGTVTYQPTAGYIGSDQFTYTIQDNSGVYSNPATVSLSILNPIPTINQVTIDSTLAEGTPAQLSATAIIAGNQPLTYTWDFGDNTAPAQGQSLQHTYANNGTYTVTLAVNSGSNIPTATQQRTITVNNIAPTVNAGIDQTANEGQSVQCSSGLA